ncbi:proline--tRNA ligase, partial [Candidatus Aerophobetes bacterium]
KLGAFFLDQKGKKHPLIMGCYGIGISRLPAAIIEQNNDKDGIIWPREVAPFDCVVIPAGDEVFDFSREVYLNLKDSPIEVVWDDRDISAGMKFKDSDLVGIPFKVIVGRTFLKEGKIEIKKRGSGEIIKVSKKDLTAKLMELIQDGG